MSTISPAVKINTYAQRAIALNNEGNSIGAEFVRKAMYGSYFKNLAEVIGTSFPTNLTSVKIATSPLFVVNLYNIEGTVKGMLLVFYPLEKESTLKMITQIIKNVGEVKDVTKKDMLEALTFQFCRKQIVGYSDEQLYFQKEDGTKTPVQGKVHIVANIKATRFELELTERERLETGNEKFLATEVLKESKNILAVSEIRSVESTTAVQVIEAVDLSDFLS